MTARRTRLRALAGNLSWLLASNGLMAALSLIYLGLLTRTLGIVDFGRFSLITGAAQMLAMLVSFETWKIVVQYGLRHAEANDQPALARLLKASMAAELASAAAGIVIVALALLASPALGLPHRLLPYAALFAIAQLLSLRSTPTGILRLKDRYGRGALADSVQPLGRLFGTLAMLAFWPSIEGFLIAYAIAEIATALVCWWLALRLTDIAQLRRTHFDRHAALAENPGLLAALWSTNVQASLSLASRQVPLLVVGSHDGPAAAGAFRLALQLANALAKLATLVMRAAFPEIVRTVSAVTRERFWALAGRIALAGFAGAVLVFLLVLLLGKPLLVLIGGSDFGVAYVLLIWLASAGCVEIAAAAFEPILFSIRRAGTVITARAAAVIVQLGAMAILIPALGARGASISVLIGALLFGIFLAIGLRRAARSA
ncbi:MAG: lipopolysaccharide biosynthesis protein [Sphingomonadales bacterium]|nr:lipopolysaccharide biosynthesis protein [Sphingomonadales bacterium]